MSVLMSVGILGAVSVLALGMTAAGAAATTAQRVSAAADAAALAAADTATGFATGDPCENAERLARAHDTTLVECALDAADVRVRVADEFAGITIAVSARAGALNGTAVMNAAGWVRPSDGEVTSPFGEREAQCDASGCASTQHQGVDFSAGCGAPIFAARAGAVVSAAADGGYGNRVRIDHGGGLISGYAHIQDDGMLVTPGDTVTAGQLIAFEGDTGQSFGCHVHVTMERDGVLVDPLPYLG